MVNVGPDEGEEKTEEIAFAWKQNAAVRSKGSIPDAMLWEARCPGRFEQGRDMVWLLRGLRPLCVEETGSRRASSWAKLAACAGWRWRDIKKPQR